MLSKEAITEYQSLYKKEFGITLTYEEAEQKAIILLRLFQIIYTPIPKEWLLEVGRKIRGKGGGRAHAKNTNSR